MYQKMPIKPADQLFYLQFDNWSSSDSGFQSQENEELDEIRSHLVSKKSKRIQKNRPQNKHIFVNRKFVDSIQCDICYSKRREICERDKITEAKFTGCLDCKILCCYSCFRGLRDQPNQVSKKCPQCRKDLSRVRTKQLKEKGKETLKSQRQTQEEDIDKTNWQIVKPDIHSDTLTESDDEEFENLNQDYQQLQREYDEDYLLAKQLQRKMKKYISDKRNIIKKMKQRVDVNNKGFSFQQTRLRINTSQGNEQNEYQKRTNVFNNLRIFEQEDFSQ